MTITKIEAISGPVSREFTVGTDSVSKILDRTNEDIKVPIYEIVRENMDNIFLENFSFIVYTK